MNHLNDILQKLENVQDLDTDSILLICGLCFIGVWGFGTIMLVVAVRKAGREFRAKGYLRKPSGLKWITFLLKRHYDGFNGASPPYFNICRVCLIAGSIFLTAAVALIGCELLLKRT